MTSSTLSIPFSQDFGAFATQLRTCGARFFVSAQGSNRILQFRQLTPAAEQLLNSVEISPIEQTVETQVETIETVEETTAEGTETTPEIPYLSAEELQSKTRHELDHLAEIYELDMSPVKKKRKAEIVEFLVGKIPAQA